MARSRTKIVMVAVPLLLIVTCVVMYVLYKDEPPHLLQRRHASQCHTNLGRIGVALLEYADRFGEGHRYPDDLEALYTTGILKDRGILVCPAQRAAKVAGAHYQYRGGLSLTVPNPDNPATLLVFELGSPHTVLIKDSPTGFAWGVWSDLSFYRNALPFDDGADRQAPREALGRTTDVTALAAALREADRTRRAWAAWAVWRMADEGRLDRPPHELRKALEAAAESGHREVVLYATLARHAIDPTTDISPALRKLKQRLARKYGPGWKIDGPRRRWLIDYLASKPSTRPVRFFAYDPAAGQREAIDRWLANWRE